MNQSKNKPSSDIMPKKSHSQLRPLWAAIFSDILGFTILIPLFPIFITEFGVSALQVGYAMSINAVFGFIFGPILSHLSDKFGRKPLLLISQIGTCVGFIVLAFSHNIYGVYISRIIDGVFGGNVPIAKAVISDVIPPKKRAKEMTNIGTCVNLAHLFGPALGGFLSVFGIMGPALASATLSFFTILLTIFLIEESAPLKTGRIQNFNSIIHRSDDINNNIQKRVNNSNIPRLITNKYFLLVLLIYSFHSIAFMTNNSGLSMFYNFKLNYDPKTIGLIYSISGVFQLFIRFVIFYPLMKKIGEKNLVTLGLGIFIGLFFIIGFVNEGYQLIIVLLFYSFAASSVRGILNSFISRTVHPKQQGLAMGVGTSMDSFAQIIGPLISGLVLQYFNLNFYGFISGILSIFAFFLIFVKIRFKYEESQSS